MAAAKAAPPADVTPSRPGVFRPKARRRAKTKRRPNSSLQAATCGRRKSKGEHHGAFRLERSVRRRLSAEEGRSLARVRPARSDQDLEPALDHPAAVCWINLRRSQWSEAHSGTGERRNGRPQIWGIRADADVLRPFLRSQSQAGLEASHEQTGTRAGAPRQRSESGGAHAAGQPAEAQF